MPVVGVCVKDWCAMCVCACVCVGGGGGGRGGGGDECFVPNLNHTTATDSSGSPGRRDDTHARRRVTVASEVQSRPSSSLRTKTVRQGNGGKKYYEFRDSLHPTVAPPRGFSAVSPVRFKMVYMRSEKPIFMRSKTEII